MSFSLVAAMLMVLGAPVSARAADLQVEAVTAAGAELPELRDAVARALVVGGARVVMRGPTTGPCDDCTQIKVTETGPGIFMVEVQEHDRQGSTTLDLSAGSRLLDRARAIAIHARLLVGKKSLSDNKGSEMATLPKGKPDTRPGSARARAKPQATVASAAEEPRTPPPLPVVVSAAEAPTPVLPPATTPAPAHTGRAENKATSHAAESKPGPIVAKVAEPDRPVPADPDRNQAVSHGSSSNALSASLATSSATTEPQWPWIPTAVGTAAALGAGLCALVAKNRYDGLSDKNQPVDHARSLKSSGENWQLTSYILAGVAAAGLGVGIAGFATRSSGGRSTTAALTPIRNGGMAVMTWELP